MLVLAPCPEMDELLIIPKQSPAFSFFTKVISSTAFCAFSALVGIDLGAHAPSISSEASSEATTAIFFI